jgi:hypothetical protein
LWVGASPEDRNVFSIRNVVFFRIPEDDENLKNPVIPRMHVTFNVIAYTTIQCGRPGITILSRAIVTIDGVWIGEYIH